MSALPDLIVNSAYSPELAELREQMDEVLPLHNRYTFSSRSVTVAFV
jgi:hypothetical protein